MPKDGLRVPAEELLNNFVFKSTVRVSVLNQEIKKHRSMQGPKETEYADLCTAVLKHADDTRNILCYIDNLNIEETEKEALRQYAGMASLESVIYNMGHALIEMKGLQVVSNINTCFVRRTRKFWIDLDNVETIYSLIIPYLPVYIFGDDGSGKISSYISSVYFDTENFGLYNKRIRRDQGAKSLRIRSYGESSIISYVELKTHEDGWTGERSTKKRFLINTKLINSLAQGTDIWSSIESINVGVEGAFALYTEVLALIREMSLNPVVKTVYSRTAFQFPGDSSIRISLDTNLAMWTEKSGKLFPYAILEVKLEEGKEPDWILELMNSPLVVPVDKFSKYLHGCSVHYDNVPCIPYWYNQITVPIKRQTEISHREVTAERLARLGTEISEIMKKFTTLESNEYALPMQADSSSSDYYERSAGVPFGSTVAIDPVHGSVEERRSAPQTKSPQQAQIQNSNINRPQTMAEENTRGNFFQPTALRATEGPAVPSSASDKPIAVPVRVEPKVFFANERTFLSWLHFAIFIGGIGAALMGLGDIQAALSGVCFVIVSIIFSIYALYLYVWRARKIKEKDPGPYDDHNGPIVLVAVFLSAMVTSVFFKFPVK
ncbi:uncharacterized protein NEMAJ01_0085 [Nematocida major]|uniref:uncharacterized protein n=1 Tax=Nematocida major TaxID=1912982 RepID=UPI0020080D5C|nr:uncharacterized protein NEMAJ01_0085 [Nematocida major]KAH9385189.1 hypothetical protein NEMAJ01_0085 [Nematocida major]